MRAGRVVARAVRPGWVRAGGSRVEWSRLPALARPGLASVSRRGCRAWLAAGPAAALPALDAGASPGRIAPVEAGHPCSVSGPWDARRSVGLTRLRGGRSNGGRIATAPLPRSSARRGRAYTTLSSLLNPSSHISLGCPSLRPGASGCAKAVWPSAGATTLGSLPLPSLCPAGVHRTSRDARARPLSRVPSPGLARAFARCPLTPTLADVHAPLPGRRAHCTSRPVRASRPLPARPAPLRPPGRAVRASTWLPLAHGACTLNPACVILYGLRRAAPSGIERAAQPCNCTLTLEPIPHRFDPSPSSTCPLDHYEAGEKSVGGGGARRREARGATVPASCVACTASRFAA